MTHLDGQRLGRDVGAVDQHVLRTCKEAEAVVARIESATLRAASVSQKVRSSQIWVRLVSGAGSQPYHTIPWFSNKLEVAIWVL